MAGRSPPRVEYGVPKVEATNISMSSTPRLRCCDLPAKGGSVDDVEAHRLVGSMKEQTILERLDESPFRDGRQRGDVKEGQARMLT